MSLFDDIKVALLSVRDTEDDFSDIDLFIGLMRDLKELSSTTKSEEFFDMLVDYRRCCVTGSSVLGKRFNLPEIAKDIDIFIDDREHDAVEILQNFFSPTNMKFHIWPAYQARTNAPNSEKDKFIGNALVVETSSESYGFKIDTYNLQTFKIKLGKHLCLNFIFLSNQPHNGKELPILNSSNAMYPFTENLLLGMEERGIIADKEYQLYSSYVLEYIEKHFDFQELKVIYDFNTKSLMDIFEASANLTELLIQKLTTVETTYFTDNVITGAGRSKKFLLSLSDEFKELYSDPEKITIAYNDQQRFSGIESIYNLDKEEALQGSNFINTAECFTALNKRIPHYQEKGFRIEDPGNVLLNLHSIICSVALSSLVDPVINNIERQAIFHSDSIVKKRYLFLNRLKGIVEENEDRLGLPLIRPPEKEIEDVSK